MRFYLLKILLITPILFLLVIFTYSFEFSDYEALAKGMNGSGKTWFFGNSVLKHSSKCDSDHRSIPQMFADSTQESVVDMSRGGMRIGRMLDIAEILLAFGIKPKTMYFQISLDGDFIKQGNEQSGIVSFFNSNFSPIKKMLNLAPVAESPNIKRVEYKGRYYGDYQEFSKNNFVLEKQKMSCPEIIGHDKDFIAFMYWRNFLDKSLNSLGREDFRNRIDKLQKKGVRVIFWLTPVNFGDINELHGSIGFNEVMAYKNKIRNLMGDFNALDVSMNVPPNFFADRWCACGHLNSEGRWYVVTNLLLSHSKLSGQ